jgi:hypothetical protein
MTTYAELRATDFAYLANCVPPAHLAGGFVGGALNATRHVVGAEALYRAFHECDDVNTEVEAYGTVYQYPAAEYRAHLRRVGSPKGYDGPAACCRLVWDIDRDNDLGAALADARTLVRFLFDRYGAHADAGLGAYFSGAKGFHVTLVALPGFHPLHHVPAVVKLLCLGVAREAGLRVDPSVYDRQRLFRLPNTRHPRTGLHKRLLSFDELFRLDAGRIRELASHPAGFAVPAVKEDCERLAEDWIEAERQAASAAPAVGCRVGRRVSPSPCPVVPDFVRRFIGFEEIQDPGRAVTLFRCAAALAEAGTPPAVVRGLLEEPALKSGLEPGEVAKQLAAGIDRGRRKEGGTP